MTGTYPEPGTLPGSVLPPAVRGSGAPLGTLRELSEFASAIHRLLAQIFSPENPPGDLLTALRQALPKVRNFPRAARLLILDSPQLRRPQEQWVVTAEVEHWLREIRFLLSALLDVPSHVRHYPPGQQRELLYYAAATVEDNPHAVPTSVIDTFRYRHLGTTDTLEDDYQAFERELQTRYRQGKAPVITDRDFMDAVRDLQKGDLTLITAAPIAAGTSLGPALYHLLGLHHASRLVDMLQDTIPTRVKDRNHIYVYRPRQHSEHPTLLTFFPYSHQGAAIGPKVETSTLETVGSPLPTDIDYQTLLTVLTAINPDPSWWNPHTINGALASLHPLAS